MAELIDTQWDVNNRRTPMNRNSRRELIDTQWDVNIFCGDLKEAVTLGINRYIVGCKLYKKGSAGKGQSWN